MSKVNFYEELKGILEEYTNRAKIDMLNNNIDKLITYWKIGNILEKIKESTNYNYEKWYLENALKLEEEYHYNQYELEYMRKLHNLFASIIDLPIMVTWEHLKVILDIEDIEEKLFYLKQVEDYNLTLEELKKDIKEDLYSSNNFNSLENIFNNIKLFHFNGHKKYKYHEFRKLITNEIKLNFLDFTKGFSYIGEDIPIQVDNKGGIIDILFYNYIIHSFVVVEIVQNGYSFKDILKISSKMCYIDEKLKKSNDNETKGVIVNIANSCWNISYVLE